MASAFGSASGPAPFTTPGPRSGDGGLGETGLRLALDAAGMGTFVWHLGQQRAQPDARTLDLLGISDPDPSVRLACAAAAKARLEGDALRKVALRMADDPDAAVRAAFAPLAK